MMREDDLFIREGLAQKNGPMDRTAEVKKRLQPIMERMKSSLNEIKRLEDSIAVRKETECIASSSGVSIEQCGDVHSRPASQNSKQLVKDSVTMLKHKLGSLQHMEEMLSSQDDRRQILQHHIIQTSLTVVPPKLCTEKKRDLVLHSKRGGVFSAEISRLHELEEELRKSRAKNKIYEKDLEERQSKVNQLSIRCEDLELQVERLSAICRRLQRSADNDKDIPTQEINNHDDVATDKLNDFTQRSSGDDSLTLTETELTDIDGDSLTFDGDVTSKESCSIDDNTSLHGQDCSGKAVVWNIVGRAGRLERSEVELKSIVSKASQSTPYSSPIQSFGKSFFRFRTAEAKRNIQVEKAKLISQGLAASACNNYDSSSHPTRSLAQS